MADGKGGRGAQVPHGGLLVPPLHPHFPLTPLHHPTPVDDVPSPPPPTLWPPSRSYLLWDTLTSSVTFQTPDVTKQSWKLRCPEDRKRETLGHGVGTLGRGETEGTGGGGEGGGIATHRWAEV